jgi:AAA15 family ATPase/GTPase
MLVKFTVGNFLSFKNRVSLDLTAKPLSEYRNDNIMESPVGDSNLLKSLIVYGFNSSGKSNLFKAIHFTKRFIISSSKDFQANEQIPVEQFRLSTDNLSKPSFFEIEFIVDASKFRYGFEVTKLGIEKEWLHTQSKSKEYELFLREGQKITLGKKFDVSAEKLMGITRKNALFLSVCAQFNNTLAISLLKAIGNIGFLSDDFTSMEHTIKLLNDPKWNSLINDFIKGANLGFNEVQVKKITITEESLIKNKVPKELHEVILKNNDKNSTVTTKHIVYDNSMVPNGETYFDLMRNESLGTKKYFSLAGPIVEAIVYGKTLIIDEFDSKLHPVLSKAIIKLFNSIGNNAQLIIASHNSTFINSNNKLFRRDQIVVVGKDRYGVSRLESLFEKKIRKDASFEKDYLAGKYEYENIPILLKINNQLDLFGENISSSE